MVRARCSLFPCLLTRLGAFVAVAICLGFSLPSQSAESESLPAAISHSPSHPRSGETVTVTAVLPDFQHATLQLQVVAPGAYIRRTDSTFETAWRNFPMEKHGATFIVSVPGEFQQHRTLLRYRISATQANSEPDLFPASTNAVPNFCWFVYDQLPAWNGASRPGRPPELTFSSDFLDTLPTYHLIAHGEDVKNSQWNRNFNRKPFRGTLVYDGRIYDHITYNNRGQASTYVAGKNKWEIKFNPGLPFLARNNSGHLYKLPWTSFDLNPCASAWAQVNRGMAGMDEALSYRAFKLAGVPSPDTFWIHFRVIDSPSEQSNNQFNTDLWGLYLVVQEKKGTWLRENNLPDGNIYSVDSGPKHLASRDPETLADFRRFTSASRQRQSEQWWRANLDLPAYYTFHALNRLLANIDLRPDGNHYLYQRPDGRVVILPHDLDMMLIPKRHQPGYINQSRCLDHPALEIEYQARAREILDLFASDPAPNGGQVGQLVTELSRHLQPPGHPRNWAELDQAMWNWHPRSQHKGQFNVTPYEDHRMGGHWTRTLSSANFDGFCKYIVDFCTDSRRRKNYRPNDGNQIGYGYGYLAYEAKDEEIPDRPEIRFTGTEGFSPNRLSFSVSPFSSPASNKPAAIQWRLSEISAPGLKGFLPLKHYRYEIQPLWLSQNLPAATAHFQLPANLCAPERTYRVRARYQDETGRWSHWSAAIQFVTAPE